MSRFALPGVGFGVAEVNTPFRYPVLATVHVETRWPRCVSLACWRIHSPILGEEWGWGRPASDLPIYGPENRTYVRTYARGHGSLPARACGAIHPCGKATNPPARRVKEAAGDGSGRVVLDADTGIKPPLTEAAHGLVARLQGILAFQSAIARSSISMRKNPMMRLGLSHAAIRRDGAGNPALDKRKQRSRIDVLSAAVIAGGLRASDRRASGSSRAWRIA